MLCITSKIPLVPDLSDRENEDEQPKKAGLRWKENKGCQLRKQGILEWGILLQEFGRVQRNKEKWRRIFAE